MVPAEAFDLLEDVEQREVVEQLVDEGSVDVFVEGVAGEALGEVAQDPIALVIVGESVDGNQAISLAAATTSSSSTRSLLWAAAL